MKKKILCLILAAFMIIMAPGNVIAWCGYRDYGNGYEFGCDGDSSNAWGRILKDEEACHYGRYAGADINAVRLTVVDKNTGQRVSGSVDFYSNGNINLVSGTRVSTEKKTRNEIIKSQTGYTLSGGTPNVEPLLSLPNFKTSSNAAAVFKNYFINEFASIHSIDMINVFNLMGYTAYKNQLLYENHALLIEPIFKISTDFPKDGTLVEDSYKVPKIADKLSSGESSYNTTVSYVNQFGAKFDDAVGILTDPRLAQQKGFPVISVETRTSYECTLDHTYYYGTATEIFSMMKQSNDKYFTYRVRQGGSVETTVHNLGTFVYDDENVGGLLNASGLAAMQPHAAGGVYSHMFDEFGLGTMHIWMKYILEGCPNGECASIPSTCPDGTPVPENGVCTEITPSTCQYPVTVAVSNDCTEGQGGTIEDGASWQCVFEAIDAPKNSYQGEFYYPQNNTEFIGNPYCNVACKESIRYELPATFEEVAGRRFSIGISNEYGSTSTLSPNRIIGKTTCSTAYLGSAENLRIALINFPQFAIDYKNANDKVAEAWDNYQIALTKDKSASNPSQKIEGQYGGDHQCNDFEDHLVVTNQTAVDACHALYAALGIADASPCDANATIENQPTRVPRDRCPAGHFEDDGNPTWTYTTVIGTPYTYIDRNGNRYDIKETYETSSCGHHKGGKPDYGVATLKQIYQNAVNYRDNLLKMLNMCNNYQRTYSEFQPKLSFAYSETKYKGTYELATGTFNIESRTDYLVDNQIVDHWDWTTVGFDSSSSVYKYDLNLVKGRKGYIDRYDCNTDGTRCTLVPGGTEYPTNVSAINITTKTYNYEIPNDANRYVAKNGVSYNTAYDAELSDYPYIDTGRSNMPVNYSTQGGWYHYYYDYYYANGTANLFGTNQKFLKYNKVDPGGTSSYNGLTLADNLLYHCIYRVNCGLVDCKDTGNTCPDGSEMPANGKCSDYTVNHKICPSGIPMPISGKCPDGKGINIIYRTISLNDPFPGEHGEGRDAGANWNGEATVLGTRMSFIDAYITNNRGVSTEKVYQETPMYQFTLTPANIRAIRKYNRSTGNDYNDYNFECSNGKYCKSEFLEEGIGNGYFGFSSKNPNGGSCFNAYSTDWESCRYSSIGG